MKSSFQFWRGCVLHFPFQSYREISQQEQILPYTLMKASDYWNASLVFDICPRESLPCVKSDRTQQPMFKHSVSSSCLSRMHPIHLEWGERCDQISEWWNRSEGIQLPHARYGYINIWFKEMWDRLSIIQPSFSIRDVECARLLY